MIHRATPIPRKALEMHSVRSSEQTFFYLENDISESDMFPSVSEVQMKIPCVWSPQMKKTFSWFIRLERQSRSQKGSAVSVVCCDQKMNKGYLYCDISITYYFYKTVITIINTN